MTKKDFVLIAEVINDLRLESTSDRSDMDFVAGYFSQALQTTNPLFDQDKFLEACGVEPDQDSNQE